MNKILRSKKGISPILATLLLIVIAVAAVVVTYAWVMTFTGTTIQQAGVMLSKENVSWKSGSVSVTIRNTGTSNAKIVSAYMGTSATNLASATVASPTLPATINAGASSSFNLTYTWAANTMYYFKFATDAPISLEFNVKSP